MSQITDPVILDQTGKDIEAAILQIAAAVSGDKGVVYGFHIDGSESDPETAVSYLKDAAGMTPAGMDYTGGAFNYGSWKDAFFMPRPCMLKTNGQVDYYLDPDDYTKKEDGTASDVANTSYDGNAMMEWGQGGKKIWMKIVPDGEKSAFYYISDHKADADFHDWPFHDMNGASGDHFYTQIYNGSLDSNNRLRSISGQPLMKTKTAEQERTYAKNNGSTYDIECKADIELINALLILMGKSLDTQTVFGQGLHTGGSEAVNDGFTTGVHNAKGLFFGTSSGTIASGSYGNAVKVFGMENWWGLQWRRYVGHVMVSGVQKSKLTYGTEDGSTVEGYNLTGEGYMAEDAEAPTGTSGGYISQGHFSKNGMFPEAASGSSSTYYCDGLWFNNGITAVPLRGGVSTSGLHVGAFFVYLNSTASNSPWNVGASLSCKPLAA